MAAAIVLFAKRSDPPTEVFRVFFYVINTWSYVLTRCILSDGLINTPCTGDSVQ